MKVALTTKFLKTISIPRGLSVHITDTIELDQGTTNVGVAVYKAHPTEPRQLIPRLLLRMLNVVGLDYVIRGVETYAEAEFLKKNGVLVVDVAGRGKNGSVVPCDVTWVVHKQTNMDLIHTLVQKKLPAVAFCGPVGWSGEERIHRFLVEKCGRTLVPCPENNMFDTTQPYVYTGIVGVRQMYHFVVSGGVLIGMNLPDKTIPCQFRMIEDENLEESLLKMF